MLDRFTLLTLSFSLILHNVCSWEVSAPLNHTFNEDDSVSVTCTLYGDETFEMDVKLMMNDQPVCEVYEDSQEDKECKWQNNGKKFTFTLMKPEALFKNVFFCEISRVRPLPVETKRGPKTKLFRGCSGTWVPPISNCSCSNQTHQEHTLEEHSLEDYIYIGLICGLIIVVMTLSLYSIIITVFYIRVKAIPEPSDTLTYVPMQRNIKRRDPDNTEYVDMREVQKRGGSHRDMNHNSHLITI